MTQPIAIVGMACLYPDARSPIELWENALARRRAFRRIVSERLRLEDYFSEDRSVPDSIYSAQAALIEGYEFDRVRYRVAGSTFRSADMTHWLALDIAAQALADAGYGNGDGLPREMTGVFLGNTLTGEFSRANLLRLRWPYVRRTVWAALAEEGWPPDKCAEFISGLEESFKKPFPPVGEETLAGGLSNTIAGRICNYFDLKGGGYTIDGACSASLLAVANGSSMLAAGDVDVALAGGVDLSMDPFELVGFAKTGALAPDLMRVYDARSAGFWPGEGCGFVVMMRYEDAVASGCRVYATIRGWGISSDGSGGITRPEIEGQLLALRRAYKRAGYGIESVSYFEGHGTGTTVGDATELKALSRALREASPEGPAAVIGSVKANIGHTKAAAGIAGLIKATMALHTQVLPPMTGCDDPHPELCGDRPRLKLLNEAQVWPQDRPLRASVSAMGFGGINAHVTLEGAATHRRHRVSTREHALVSSSQDAELFLLEAATTDELLQQLSHLSVIAPRLSLAEMSDLAVCLQSRLNSPQNSSSVRAAIVASTPSELTKRLEILRSWASEGVKARLDLASGVFIGKAGSPRIGFLFPGQGSPSNLDGGALRRRFDCVKELYEKADLPTAGDAIETSVAQPAIATASTAGLRVLHELALEASVAVGHSLGELAALHWAGAMDEDTLLRIAAARGKAMSELGSPTGTMASIRASRREVESLLNGGGIVIAGLNSPTQTVISGEASAVSAFLSRARAKNLIAVSLPVSHAFHSPLVAAAAPSLARSLSLEKFMPLSGEVISTVTGNLLSSDDDLADLLYRQITSPVRFTDALTKAVEGLDLLIEVGPGQVLKGLARETVNTPVIAVDCGGPSLKGLLQAVGAAFALGANIDHAKLFSGRFARPFNLDYSPAFFINPCELAPVPEDGEMRPFTVMRKSEEAEDTVPGEIEFPEVATNSLLDLVRHLVAERAELPASAVKDDNRLLGDLHLNSITVSQLVAEAARKLGLSAPVVPTDYSNVTVAEVGQALEEMTSLGGVSPEKELMPSGVDSWVNTFTVDLVERPLLRIQPKLSEGEWRVIASDDYPLKADLEEAFSAAGGGGVVVCLPPGADERHISLLLEGARAVFGTNMAERFVMVQHGGGAAAFARTLHLEAREVTTCVVDVPLGHPDATSWVVAEALSAVGYSEAHYDESGKRRQPVLRLWSGLEETDEGEIPLGPDDLLLVTGGGKGIAAECALDLARETGVRLALVGRSDPDRDVELASNLDRMTAEGICFFYIRADVTDGAAVKAAVRETEAYMGPVTAFLHGAGSNVPQLLTSLDEAAFLNTLAPKLQGARNVLAAVDPKRLKLLITFGSLIARAGMKGEADYAVANEWLVRLTEQWQADHPHCRCLAVEYSVWSGVGMGQRLGRIDSLIREGIAPIPPDKGIAILRRLLARRLPATAMLVTGRFGEAPTLTMDQGEFPLLRFLEEPKIYYPGVEIVVDSKLSADTDPYLNDHVFQGERIFPGVMGLEAMAQAVMALKGSVASPGFEHVEFKRPIVVPDGSSVTIRVAALAAGPDLVQVVLRSEETAFQLDHFRATCRVGNPMPHGECENLGWRDQEDESTFVQLSPDKDLYGGILFHGGRFKRLRGYRWLKAKECFAEISPDGTTQWFGQYMPGRLVLGDPGARDAAIHAIQACIPHATLIPIGIDRLTQIEQQSKGPWFVRALERSREGDTFTYDVDVLGADGVVEGRWEGLRLRLVGQKATRSAWAAPLLGNYLERKIQELVPDAQISIAIDQDIDCDRRLRSDRAIQRAVGATSPVLRRSDGRPEFAGSREIEVSAAHADDVTIAVAGPGPVGCDIEPVADRTQTVWRDLLGMERLALATLIADETGEDEASASTRVWAATESLKKAGMPVTAPLVLTSCDSDGWVSLASGALVIVTCITEIQASDQRFAVAVLMPEASERLARNVALAQ